MTKTAFEYIGKKGTYIKTEVLSKAPKDADKSDRIKLSINSKYDKFAKVLTPYEAVIISNALLNAIILDNEARRKLR